MNRRARTEDGELLGVASAVLKRAAVRRFLELRLMTSTS